MTRLIVRLATAFLVGVLLAASLTVGAQASSPAGFSVAGHVTDQAGTPFLGVGVQALDSSSQTVVATAMTDASGNFQVVLPSNLYDFSFQPPTSSGLRSAVIRNVQ